MGNGYQPSPGPRPTLPTTGSGVRAAPLLHLVRDPRALDDRLGELLRRQMHGLVPPLWADCDDVHRAPWLKEAAIFRERAAALGLALVEKKPRK